MKTMYRLLILISTVLLSWGCNSTYKGVPKHYHSLLDSAMVKAGDNSSELLRAIEEAAIPQKEGMAFLISYMPERDLVSLTADFLLENSEYAAKSTGLTTCRREVSQCRRIKSITWTLLKV